MTADFDVVIVSYNTRAVLDGCLASLHASPLPRLRQIFVVDNGSTDGSADHVRVAWPLVQLIALDRNVGFAAANNIALRQARASLVLLLNPDTIVPPGAIDRLIDRLVETEAVAAGPRLVDDQRRPEVSFGRMLSPLTELRQRILVRQTARNRPGARHRLLQLVNQERDVDWVSGACLLVRRDSALRAGLFDERYFMYEEDVDFCAALRAQGGRIIFTPASEVVHLRGRSAAASTTPVSAHYDRSHVAFYEKHRPGWAPFLRLWLRVRGRTIR